MSQAQLADWLISKGRLAADQLQGEQPEGPLDAWLLGRDLVTLDDVLQGLGELHGVPAIGLESEEVDRSLFDLISPDMARNARVLPLRRVDADTVRVAMADPSDAVAEDFVRFALGGSKLEKVVVSSWDLDRWYERLNAPDPIEEAPPIEPNEDVRDLVPISFTEDELNSLTVIHDDDGHKEEEQVTQLGPAIRVVTSLLSDAVAQKASDIHFEPVENGLRVRFRIDGYLREVTELPQVVQPMILSRLKLSANLDIAERRRPQDGRTRMQLAGKIIDFRVSTLPTYFGEKIVMRILDNSKGTIDIKKLGFEQDDLDTLLDLVHMPLGMILITGPTGSGKTTTLYACLTAIDDPKTNIVTVEDPVEYQIFGINQVHVNPKTGLTFSSALRSILRQDPDVVMIGEIRDLETALIAFEAAMTGHLVLSTLHTNDAPSAITRLVHLGVPKYLVASSLQGVLAQRLVRRICPSCRTTIAISDENRDILRRSRLSSVPTVFYGGKGCKSCFETGYTGRTGLYEMLKVTDRIKGLIYTDASDRQFREAAREQGMRTLLEDGLLRVSRGEVTIEEVLSVAPAGMEASGDEAIEIVAPATFGVDLETAWLNDPARVADSEPASGSRHEGASRVVVVDEDDTRRHALRETFEAELFEVAVARDARAALETAFADTPCLVVASLGVRDDDVIGLVRKLRTHASTRDVPIILLAPQADSGREGAGFAAGADDVLAGPVEPARLVLRAEALLKRARVYQKS